jgi:hypothetical protein
LDEVTRFAEFAMASCDRPLREAIVMAAWELTQNLLKYGTSDDPETAGTITIAVDADTVRIRTRSQAESLQNARSALSTVSRIASKSVSDLYRERLRELFERPRQQRAKLGLLRVAFEGGFRLTCSYEAPYLEVTAERARRS